MIGKVVHFKDTDWEIIEEKEQDGLMIYLLRNIFGKNRRWVPSNILFPDDNNYKGGRINVSKSDRE